MTDHHEHHETETTDPTTDETTIVNRVAAAAAEGAPAADEAPAAEQAPAPDEDAHVDVRRNALLSGVVALLAAGLAAAFGARALADGAVLDWAGFAVLGLVTILHLAALADSRAPLLIADRHGVRLRQGATWQGIAWPEVECLEHLPRRGLFRDGHVLVVGYDDRQLVVPLTLATKVLGAGDESLSDALAGLADGRADVVEVVPGLEDAEEDQAEATGEVLRRPSGAAGTDADLDGRRDADPDSAGADADADTGEIAAVGTDAPRDDPAGPVEPTPTPSPGRPTVLAARVEVQHPGRGRGAAEPFPVHGANALHAEAVAGPVPLPEGAMLRRDEEELTVVIDDLSVRPAPDPVIGPQLAAARERIRLTVDQLSERTRIRPHVIEAIEVDDFGPCGGDFYARGHLRTLSRVLGIEAAPLLATYDERYADAPVDPKRVFEAELATGVGGSIRSTRGGRNWSVLVAAVMAAVLVWSVARLVMDGPVPVGDVPVLNQSGGLSKGAAGRATPVPVTLTAAGGGANLVVRDGSGDVVFDGQLAFGQTTELKVVPPVRVWSSDGSVAASVDGEDAEPLGDTGQEVTTTLVAP